jgi:DNA polymerase
MMQTELQRRAYLRAMGIDVWIPRDQTDPECHAEVTEDAVEGLDWDGLKAAVSGCTRCPLHQTRTQTVFGVGSPDADWMIIGEAPGAEEDRRGEPFVGRAGKLLDEMLRAIGEARESVFIANVLKCRPPNNRDPGADESAACRSHLERQIELVQPRIILAVGRIAAHLLLDTDEPVGRMRGKVHQLGETPLIVTYHPAYLLRSPSQKRKSWDDLCLARRVVSGGPE